MTDLPDPVCLDVPEHELCQGVLPVPPRLGAENKSRRRVSHVPPLSISACLHAGLIALAMTLGMSVGTNSPVVTLTLLPAVELPGDGGPPVVSDSFQAAAPEPVKPDPPVQKTVTKPEKALAKQATPERVVRKALTPRKEISKQVEPVAAPQTSERVEPAPTAPDISTVAQDTDISAVGSSSDVSGSKHSEASAQHGTGIGGTGKGQGLPLQTKFGDADGPRFVQRVVPKYPELARRKGREGLVMLRLTIAPDGRLLDVRVEDGGGFGFEDAAMEAVRASTYAPATRNGQAVECSALLPIRFALQGT